LNRFHKQSNKWLPDYKEGKNLHIDTSHYNH
jgi:hypothetical protein